MQFLKPLRVLALGAALPLVQAQNQELREAARLDAAGDCLGAEKIYSRLLSAGLPSVALMNNAGNHYLTCREPARAEGLFREVLTMNPAHGNANLQMARLQLAAGRAAGALPYAERARNEGPDAVLVYAEVLHFAGHRAAARDTLAALERTIGNDHRLLFALALTQERVGEFERAEDAYSRLLAQTPDNPQLLFRLGRSAARAGHFDRAIRALQTAAKLTPADVDVLLELGRALIANSQAPKAVYVLAHARKLAPRRADVLLTLARAAEEAGYYGDSALAYDEYLALQPDDVKAKRDRALVYGMTQSRLAEGLRDLQAHVQKYPSDATAWFDLARLTWASDPQQALGYLDRAVGADGKSPSVRFARAWLLYQVGRAGESVVDLLAALEAAPKNVRVLAQLGLTYLSLDKPAEAEKCLRRALTEAPDDPEALLHLGRALVALDLSEEAQPYLLKFQQLRPSVVRGPRTEAGMIELATIPEQERVRREIERLRADLQAHPGDVEIQLHFAGLLLAAGRRDEAAAAFDSAVARGVDARLAHRTGRTLFDAGQYETAKKFLEAAAGAIPEACLDLAMTVWRSSGPRAGLDVLNAVAEGEQSADSLLLKARLLDAAGDSARSVGVLEAGLQRTAAHPR
ncbi:MAG TPA: tetratricopeptide repeat protein, partial [Bryobacteraceae bacterium]|nr:tetratricopeptide repeat protein [Bryobacteraceae bacterium]